MYLFPTEEELKTLWRQINPRDRYIAAVRAAVDDACRFGEESMASFFANSEDVYLAEEEGAMHYHIDPPAYLEYSRGTDAGRFNGSVIAMPRGLRRNAGIYDDYAGVDLGEKVEWDEI